MHSNCSGTEKCIKCGKKAILWHGYLEAKERMALGNLIDVKVLAGFCSEKCSNSAKPEFGSCYGEYNKDYGLVENVFKAGE